MRRCTYLCAGLRNRTEVVDHVSLGHTDTGIPDGEDLVLLVWGDSDEEVLSALEN